jgi:GT2 family glycosyltransferase
MTDISIIIVNWNAREHLLKCLESVYRNLPKNYTVETIVVDNGSTDGSPEVVESKFPQVILIKNGENMGFSSANNIGIHRSVGRYLCLVNSDVIMLDSCLEKLVEYMDGHEDVGMAGPRILNIDRGFQPSCQCFPGLWNNFCHAVGLSNLFPKSSFFSKPYMEYWAHDSEKRVDALNGCFWIMRRSILDKVGLLDERFFIYGEDMDMCKRFNKAGWGVVFCPYAEVIHVGGASSANAPIKFYLEMQKADLQYWRKHHGRTMEFLYRTIILLRHSVRVICRAIQYALCPSCRPTVGFKLRRSAACVLWALGVMRR